MLNFILYHHIFEILLIIISSINTILLGLIDTNNKSNSNSKNLDEITKYKLYILLITTFIFIFILAKNMLLSVFFLILPTIAFFSSIKKIYTKKNSISLDDKYIYVSSTLFFIAFLTAYHTPIYISSFSNVTHNIKEILLILYIIIKIITFTFLLSINIITLLSNIFSLLEIKHPKLMQHLYTRKKNNIYNLILYDFILYKKYKTLLTKYIDILIFFILCIPTIIINIFYFVSLKILKKIITLLFKTFSFITNDEKKKNLIIKKVTNISIIIALGITFIITVNNNTLFSENITKIFEFITTVIIIPFVYDTIK